MMKEHDRVVLTAPVPNEHLEIGDVGTVVHVYADGRAFEIEFMTLDGQTAAVATVEAFAVCPVTGREITHSRELRAS
jgi:non-homologous end joining protein Ku